MDMRGLLQPTLLRGHVAMYHCPRATSAGIGRDTGSAERQEAPVHAALRPGMTLSTSDSLKGGLSIKQSQEPPRHQPPTPNGISHSTLCIDTGP